METRQMRRARERREQPRSKASLVEAKRFVAAAKERVAKGMEFPAARTPKPKSCRYPGYVLRAIRATATNQLGEVRR